MGKYILKIIAGLFAVFSVTYSAGDINGKMTVDGIEREYILHLPKNYGSVPLPLVMVFHGGGGTAEQIKDHVKFSKLADKENFIVVYPNAVDKNWNDGRIGDKLPMDRDDVKFISMLIDTLTANYHVNSKRIFSTGISNGGFFSFYLALKLSTRILAIAPVTANIPENLKDSWKTEKPVSVLLINGTKDPLVKFDGGPVGFKDDETGRGVSLSTSWTVKILTENNSCMPGVKVEEIDDKEDDDCKAEKETYYKCADGTKVILVTIKGGGHTWPGASQYLPKIIVGNVCKDFNATEMIWEFFKSLPERE
ncbi:MAG TPA: PHB depolymerase family esterase [Ignavibacteria bacterium]|nr:PHB depolymerase family esterase [Ignavibacteria bacterium]